MSTISSVTATPDAYPSANPGGKMHQLVQNFQAIGSALASGDVATAQTALASFQQALQGNPQGSAQGSSQKASSQPFGKDSQANTDYQNLTSALQSGNLSTAQKAYASLQNDLKAAATAATATKSAHRGHHHHHSEATDSAASSTTTPSSTNSTSPTESSNSSSTSAKDGSLNALA